MDNKIVKVAGGLAVLVFGIAFWIYEGRKGSIFTPAMYLKAPTNAQYFSSIANSKELDRAAKTIADGIGSEDMIANITEARLSECLHGKVNEWLTQKSPQGEETATAESKQNILSPMIKFCTDETEKSWRKQH